MTSKLIVDRIDNDVVVCQDMDGNEVSLSVSQTDNVREGDVIVLMDGVYRTDKDLTKQRRDKIIALQDELWA